MSTRPEFQPFAKIARYSRECIITEKLDGTNAQVYITDAGELFAGSRNRWLSLNDDNFGFAKWAHDNKEELLKLGPGRHFGEWWGAGIQRRYNQTEKHFSLFNVSRWNAETPPPACCRTVPVLYRGMFTDAAVASALHTLASTGSVAVPGFMQPEGIIIYHVAAGICFKKTLEKDDEPKTKNAK